MQRCDALGGLSDEESHLTRTFHSPAMQRANSLVAGWMHDTGLETREDAAFNLIGRWPAARKGAKTFLLGSHLDTVRNAGKFDGPLGVLVALAAIEQLRANDVSLPFHLEVIGFSDEEGVRYQTTYLGSRAMAGTLRPDDLRRVAEKGIERARRRPAGFLGYAEVHIEQGPVLESEGLALGVVTGIAGQSRLRVEIRGQAGHAGTTPLELRRDALCAAAEFILAVETCGVTATVGQIEALPGASNVIPGEVNLTVDVRHFSDPLRKAAVAHLGRAGQGIARRRKVTFRFTTVQDTAAVQCDEFLTGMLSRAVLARQHTARLLPSGAGHDAAAMSALCPVAMLFVRCKGGLSHHPAESVKTVDVAAAIAVLCEFLQILAEQHG